MLVWWLRQDSEFVDCVSKYAGDVDEWSFGKMMTWYLAHLMTFLWTDNAWKRIHRVIILQTTTISRSHHSVQKD